MAPSRRIISAGDHRIRHNRGRHAEETARPRGRPVLRASRARAARAFFWYRCPHCDALEPQLTAWVQQLPRDVQFDRVPAVFNDDWATDARIFYTLEAMGQVQRVHRALFDAIHQQGAVRLKGAGYAKWVADWLAKHGVDPKMYDAAYSSVTVSTQVRRARQMTVAYKFDGVPAIAVQGRWLVNASTSMLSVTSYLIDQARKATTTRK